ncbi:uncharacterized protein LOC141619825 [Silene latifolia]|uniref:uncharacterized protein LOC141619825 n=1 Tax=Silene latifolia TaxID=37657 RepID=UPI003D76D0E0
MKVESLSSKKCVNLTFVYAFNAIHKRVPLWSKLKSFAAWIRGLWAVAGDFNCVLDHNERCGGNSCQKPEDRTYSRLDRFMIDQDWTDHYPDVLANFLPEGNYDHTPSLKVGLKKLNNKRFSDIENNTNILQMYVHKLQSELGVNPNNPEKIMEDFKACQDLKEMTIARDCFLAQKAKASWISEGGANTAFFHGAIKRRRIKNKVIMIEDMEAEVKEAIFSIPDMKSPGPDEYTRRFYKDAWSEISDDVTSAITDFFYSRKLLKQINSTTLTLIPKCESPQNVLQFRPIAYCNMIYKAISKILCTRLGIILPSIVDQNQGACIQGRSILENVLICQDLVRLYKRPAASARCVFKIDLQNAYDTVEWDFVDHLMAA